MKNKLIIIVVVVSFILCSFSLTLIEKNQSDKNYQKNWWSVYFTDPKSNDLSFTIENHSDKNNFHWEILSDKKKINEGDAIIIKGTDLTLNPTVDLELSNKKIIIQVISENNKKQIYKNF